MALISKILRNGVDNRLLWHCPGCGRPHVIKHTSSNDGYPVWGWNGDVDAPTFTPSVLVRSSKPSDVESEYGDQAKDVPTVCHSYVVDGHVQFLTDCTHSLAGQTVKIPDWPNPEGWVD